MSVKKFIPCIYLYNKLAVKSFDDMTVVKADPVKLAMQYSNLGADALILMDLSPDIDEAHEEALDMIKEICDSIDIPVIGGGNVKRMEDIKKLLYAGCSQAILNYSKNTNVDITKEVSLKFGKDKIIASVANLVELNDNLELIKEYVSSILFLTGTSIEDALHKADISIIGMFNGIKTSKLIEACENENLIGITGDVIAESDSISEIKTKFEKEGISTTKPKTNFKWEQFKKNSDGHVTVVVQDVKTDEVLMVAYMNEEAYNKTISSGKMTYYSRSRDELWIKGETSGHYQYLQSLYVDCDNDTLLAKVTQVGAACHTGNKSCFYTPIYSKDIKTEDNPLKVFEDVLDIIKDRKVNPKEGSYTNYLFDKGVDKILKKLGEEATEIVIAAKNPNPNEIKYEISDFLYHMMVLMVEKGVSWEEITEELAKR